MAPYHAPQNDTGVLLESLPPRAHVQDTRSSLVRWRVTHRSAATFSCMGIPHMESVPCWVGPHAWVGGSQQLQSVLGTRTWVGFHISVEHAFGIVLQEWTFFALLLEAPESWARLVACWYCVCSAPH